VLISPNIMTTKSPFNLLERQTTPSALSFRSLTGAVCFCLVILMMSVAVADSGPAPRAADAVEDGQPIDITSPLYQDLFFELQQQHGFSLADLAKVFNDLRIDKKVLQLMDRQGEAKPYYQYRANFITAAIIAIGKQQLVIHQALFDRIEEMYGVDREAIVAIWAMETRFGTNQGTFGLWQTINTLFAAYPRRSSFYRGELIEFLLLCRRHGLDPQRIKGSYAGAFGQAQFIPSSYNKYAVDFDGDGRPDLVRSYPDIFASIANYLKKFGWNLHTPLFVEIGRELQSPDLIKVWQEGRTGRMDWRRVAALQQIDLPPPPQELPLSLVGVELAPQQGGGMRFLAGYPNFQVITEYNHSSKYAMAVAEMAEAFKQ
jgi:membrane-bound lytic murein transglycosylase B